MTGSGRRKGVNLILWIVAPIALLAVVRPWTVRPLEGDKPAVFEADAFAASSWPRIVREASQTAADVADLVTPAAGAAAKPRFVKGAGVVAAIDRQSRVGLMRVQLSGARPVTVAIQIGPVIRGTALRDATDFIQFSDFKNQFDYAGAANALNDHALRSVIDPAAVDALQGKAITFIGAIGKSPAREDGSIEIVAVQVAVVEASSK